MVCVDIIKETVCVVEFAEMFWDQHPYVQQCEQYSHLCLIFWLVVLCLCYHEVIRVCSGSEKRELELYFK